MTNKTQLGLMTVATVAMMMIGTVQAVGADYTWNSTSGGNWSDVTVNGWNTGGAYPNAIADSAIFSQNFGGSKTFTLDVDATVGVLTLACTAGNYALILSGANTLTFDATGTGRATLSWARSVNDDGTKSTISVPLMLNDDLVATGSTSLEISGNITGAGKTLTVNPTTAAAQMRITGNNTNLTGGIVLNNSSHVKFGSLYSMGGGGSGNVLVANGAVGVLNYNPGSAANVNAAIAKLDPSSSGMFGNGQDQITGTYAVDLSGITNIRYGTWYSTYHVATGSSLVFDFANNGNKYAIGGIAIGGAYFDVQVGNLFTGARNLDVLPQTLILQAAQDYSGTTTLSDNPAGIIQGSTHGGINLVGNGSVLNTSGITLNRGTTLTVNNQTVAGIVTTAVNLTDRVNDAAPITMNGGNIVYAGFATGDSTETLGAITLGTGSSTFRINYGGAYSAALTASSLTRTTGGGGSMLVNGIGLGKDTASAASIARLLLGSAPTLVGTTDATATGINAVAQNTKIVPFLVGAATTTSGGVGTAGAANTFVTCHATTGLRPLNPTDEFSNNAIVAGHNIYVTGATTAADDATINSLVINGNTLTISNGKTLAVTSGAVLFSSANHILGGTLAFGATEAMLTSTQSGPQLNSVITGSAGVTIAGGKLYLGGANTYTGPTTVSAGTLATYGANKIPDSSALTVADGATFQLENGGDTVGSIAGPGNYGLNSFTLTAGGDNTSTAVSGVISGGSGGLVKTGSGTLTLSGANTYGGTTTVSDGTLLVSNTSGSGTGAGAVTVSAGATLGGTGILTGEVAVDGMAHLLPGGAGNAATLTLGPLTIAGNAIVDWEYDGAESDLLAVVGDIVLPSVLTVNVNGLSGTLADAVLFSWTGANTGTTDLSAWTVTGGSAAVTYDGSGRQVLLSRIPAGTVILIK